MEVTQALGMIMSNPDTSWIGYLTLALVIVTFGMATASTFLLRMVDNLKKIAGSMKPKEKPDYKKQIKMEADVSGILRGIRHDLHADRVCVLQYHNGVYSIAENSLLKISMTHESLSLNVRSVRDDIQNWFANQLGSIGTEIFDGRYVAHTDVEEMNDDPELRSVLQYIREQGIKSLYCFPVTDVYGKTFGIGVVQYIRRKHELDAEWVRWARDRFVSIGTLLAGLDKEDVVK